MSVPSEQTNGPKAPATPKTRSPNYPAIDLRAAIERARIVYRRMGKHATGVDVVANLWSSSPKSSSFKLALAAVRAFGLFEGHAGENDRLVKVSLLALNILEYSPDGSSDWLRAVRECALKPKLHATLWEKYNGELPADEEIRRHLLRDRGFHHKTVDEFIEEFRETLAFARLPDDDIIPDPEDDGREEETGRPRQAASQIPAYFPSGPVPMTPIQTPPATMTEFAQPAGGVPVRILSLPLDETRTADVRLPIDLNVDDIDQILGHFDLLKKRLMAKSKSSGASGQP